MQPSQHAFRQFAQDLKNGNIKGTILLYGSEPFLFKWAVDELTKKFVEPSFRAFDRAVIYDDELNGKSAADVIIEACETMPMLSERRVVWVREPKFLAADDAKSLPAADVERLATYLEKGSFVNDAILIFTSTSLNKTRKFSRRLVKAAKCYEFGKLDRRELTAFANKRFREARILCHDREMNELLDETGYFNRESSYDLYAFENDLAKLIALTDNGRLEGRTIADAISGDRDTYVFDLIDSVSSGRKDRALDLLHNKMTMGDDGFGLIGLLTGQFELMLTVRQMRRDNLNAAAIARRLSANEYRIKKMIPYAERFDDDRLKRILLRLYDADRDIKTGVMDARLALELFIASI